MRTLFAAALLAAAAAAATAQDKKGTAVELAGMKSTTPGDWKEEPLPAKSMRMQQFRLPKAEGDAEDADLALFFFRGNAGTVQQNLERQEKKFEIPAGTKAEDAIKVAKTKVGTVTAKQVEAIAKQKLPDLNCDTIESAMKSVRGTARSMGLDVID